MFDFSVCRPCVSACVSFLSEHSRREGGEESRSTAEPTAVGKSVAMQWALTKEFYSAYRTYLHDEEEGNTSN